MHTFIICFLLGVVNDQASFIEAYVPAFDRLTTVYSRIQMNALITQYNEHGTISDCTAARCFLFDEYEQLWLGPCDEKIPTYVVNAKGVPETQVSIFAKDHYYWLSKPIGAEKFKLDGQRPIKTSRQGPFDKRLRGMFLPISAPFGSFGRLTGEICAFPSFEAPKVTQSPDGKVRVEFKYSPNNVTQHQGHWVFDSKRAWVLLEQETKRYVGGEKPEPFTSIIRCEYAGKLYDDIPKLVRVEEFARELKTDKEKQFSTIDIFQLEPLNSTDPFRIENFDLAK